MLVQFAKRSGAAREPDLVATDCSGEDFAGRDEEAVHGYRTEFASDPDLRPARGVCASTEAAGLLSADFPPWELRLRLTPALAGRSALSPIREIDVRNKAERVVRKLMEQYGADHFERVIASAD